MATVETKVDDFDHTKPADETIVFGIDGKTYTIDLSGPNARDFRDTMGHYVLVARQLVEDQNSTAGGIEDAAISPSSSTTSTETYPPEITLPGTKPADRALNRISPNGIQAAPEPAAPKTTKRASKSPRTTGGKSPGTRRNVVSNDARSREAIRAWARSSGHQVSDRGRISAELVELFNRAHGVGR